MPEHQRHLRHHAGQGADAAGDHGVGVHGVQTLVQARAGGVENGDQGRAGLLGEIHDFEYLFGVLRADGTALDGEVLRVDVNGLFVDQAVAGDDAGVGVEHVELDKARSVKQPCHALPCQELSGFFLLVAKLRVALQDRQLALTNDGQIAFHTHAFSLQNFIGHTSTNSIESNFMVSPSKPFFLLSPALIFRLVSPVFPRRSPRAHHLSVTISSFEYLPRFCYNKGIGPCAQMLNDSDGR